MICLGIGAAAFLLVVGVVGSLVLEIQELRGRLAARMAEHDFECGTDGTSPCCERVRAERKALGMER